MGYSGVSTFIMAVPSGMTLRTLNGRFTINRMYSDSVDKMMALQGFPYLVRMAARTASIELNFTSIAIPEPETPNRVKDQNRYIRISSWHVPRQAKSGRAQHRRCPVGGE